MSAASLRPFSTDTQSARRYSALRDAAGDLLELAEQAGVEDVVVNPDETLWVNTTGEGFRVVGRMEEAHTRSVLLQIAHIQGLPFGVDHPVLETDLPLNGARITGLCRPAVRGTALAIRPHPKSRYRRRDYVEAGIVSHKDDPRNAKSERARFLDGVRGKDHSEVLALAVLYRQNILIGGTTGSGKTTFLNMLLWEIGDLCPNDRVVGIEDTLELQWDGVKNYVSLLAGMAVPAEACLISSLRLKPHRIVVGEVRRQAVAQTLLEAWNTGHRGGLATVHADDAESALQRFEELLRDEGCRSSIARAVNVVVFIDECEQISAGRKVREVLVVHGFDLKTGGYRSEYV